jgi:hypothetical protein
MDTDSAIAFSAILIGMTQMAFNFNDIRNTTDFSNYSFEYTVLGILGSFLWTVYQYRKGSNFSAAYSASAVILGFYILHRVLKNKKEKQLNAFY